ncbi:histidine phosphatase family protein [Roseovarius aestuariivivens]|uniref:histidine phosphatase family protein n=1 Tax=Roseovarius aestuariivivens TaxID=1888910 RepID=UPI00108125A9|nr:histidine phosphatase family protein [Roseovarius aestuariivivens]
MTPDQPLRLPELWILRHGQTEWNVEDRLQGRLDSPLTAQGMAQARAQGSILRSAALPHDLRVISSPSGRALHTARIAADGLGPLIETDPALFEIDLGAWQGRRVAEIPEAQEARDPHLWKFTGPGCERLEEMAARLTAFLAALDRPAVIVTHGVTSRMLRCLALGRALEALGSVPGGQGVVHHLRQGTARVIAPPVA